MMPNLEITFAVGDRSLTRVIASSRLAESEAVDMQWGLLRSLEHFLTEAGYRPLRANMDMATNRLGEAVLAGADRADLERLEAVLLALPIPPRTLVD